MLTPDYLAHCTDYLLGLYDELDRAIIADIARRIIKTGNLTPTARHQITMAQNSGLLLKDITKLVSQTSGLSKKEVKRMFQDAAITGMKNDARPLLINGKKVELKLSNSMQQTMQASIDKTNGDVRNLTLTLGSTANGKYVDAINTAYMKVQSGAFSYSQAIRDAIKQAAGDGNYVSYGSGHRDRLDVAVRRSVLTGLNQTAGKLTEMYGKDMGCEYYETSAHAGARPTHSVWQGRVFKIEGSTSDYPNFYEATGYGTGEGLCGWNCRHSFYPFFPGLSVPAYSRKTLDWYNEPRFEYNDSRLTEYEVSQLMRKSERAIRETKRELAGLNAAIEASEDDVVKGELQECYTESSLKLKKQKAKYKDLCKQTDHKEDATRTSVVAIKDSGGNIVSWNQSNAQRARRAAEKAEKTVVTSNKGDTISLTSSESGALIRYKSFESYTINDALRSGRDLSDSEQDFVRDLDSALSKTPKYRGNLVRTVDFSDYPDSDQKVEQYLENFEVGKTITIDQYWSTSKKAGYNENAQVIIYIEDAKNGHDISSIGLDESEVLYERNSSVEVISKQFYENKWYILVKEV